jgi:hypothetical protein
VNNTAIKDIALAVSNYISQIHAHSQILRESIESASNMDELNNIDIENGWSEI